MTAREQRDLERSILADTRAGDLARALEPIVADGARVSVEPVDEDAVRRALVAVRGRMRVSTRRADVAVLTVAESAVDMHLKDPSDDSAAVLRLSLYALIRRARPMVKGGTWEVLVGVWNAAQRAEWRFDPGDRIGYRRVAYDRSIDALTGVVEMRAPRDGVEQPAAHLMRVAGYRLEGG